MDCLGLACWFAEHLDTIVVSLLTLIGFGLQYWHFEKKISRRDQRDLFMRKVEEPVAQLQRDYSRAAGSLQVWLRGIETKSSGNDHEIFSGLVVLNREFNMATMQLNNSKFDCGDGWIALDTERLEDSLEAFSGSPSVASAKCLLSKIDEFNKTVTAQLNACRRKFAPDT